MSGATVTQNNKSEQKREDATIMTEPCYMDVQWTYVDYRTLLKFTDSASSLIWGQHCAEIDRICYDDNTLQANTKEQHWPNQFVKPATLSGNQNKTAQQEREEANKEEDRKRKESEEKRTRDFGDWPIEPSSPDDT